MFGESSGSKRSRTSNEQWMMNVALQKSSTKIFSYDSEVPLKILGQAKVFLKLDLNQGYHQLELAPESCYITTFSTHVGLRHYKRLNVGVNSAAEIFQEAIRSVIEGVLGSLNIRDDIIVYGSMQDEHDEHLESVLEHLHQNN
ncbi:Hypothetical predicted protein [Paramuricea clavata]|uniref:Reverse transcriptase domain-containing protein n=1 Tax=Paramuricea clavata TaxID=317549 RepID=A0A6S7HL25_PARCT|nr:Hypothetical predicted protein [Paramuricea clavata]